LILEYPNYINLETTKNIKEAIRPFIANKKQTQFYRDGNTVLISQIPELKKLDDELHELFSKIQKEIISYRFKPKFSSADTGYEYHLYNPKEICHYHSDDELNFVEKNSVVRYASVVLQLNTVQEGGELIFPNQDVKIKTEEGKLVIFPPYSMFGHYTTPSEQPREVIVTWFCYQNITAVQS
jgi:hypothetical protein